MSIATSEIGHGTEVAVRQITGNDAIMFTLYDIATKGKIGFPKLSDAEYDLELTIEKVYVEALVKISAAEGEFEVGLLDPQFAFEGLEVAVSDPNGEVPATAGVEGPVVDSLETFLTETALTLGVRAMEIGLGRLTEPLTYTIIGTDVSLQLTAVAADVGDHGIELRLGGHLTILGETVVPEDPGALRTPIEAPFHPRSDGATIAISDDLVNTILHEVWRVGKLKVEVNQQLLDELKAPVYFVAGFLGGLAAEVGDGVDPEAPLFLEVSAPLPPVLMAVEGSDAIAIALGDITLDFHTADAPLAKGIIALRMAAGAVTEGESLLLDLFPFDVAFDLETEDVGVKRRVEGTVEPFVTALLEELSPLFSKIIGALPLPDMGKIRPAALSAGDGGTNGDYLVLTGALHVE